MKRTLNVARGLCLLGLIPIAVADKPGEIKAYSPLYVLGDSSGVLATGAWDVNIPANTRNAIEINCSRQTNQCVVAEAYVDQGGGVFSVHMFFWRVTSWTDAEVTAVGIEACDTTTLTINFAYKEVLQITRNGGSLKGGCTPSPLDLKRPITKKLVSGELTPAGQTK